MYNSIEPEYTLTDKQLRRCAELLAKAGLTRNQVERHVADTIRTKYKRMRMMARAKVPTDEE